MIALHAATGEDMPFLWEMLYQAIFVPPGEVPPSRAVLALPPIAHYLVDYGRVGDFGLVAAADDRPVGAAWYRLLPDADPGYGFVAGDIPELTVAVQASWRGRRVGTQILEGLIAHARDAGYRALSLSVHPQNPARHLYGRLGFVQLAVREGALVMLRPLGSDDPALADAVRLRQRLA